MNRKIITSAALKDEYQLVEVEPGEWWYENAPGGGDIYPCHGHNAYENETERVLVLAGDEPETAMVILFKPSGKYYTEEKWRIPITAIGPYDMQFSPDFRRISGGPVLVPTQEPWGYPFLIVAEEA